MPKIGVNGTNIWYEFRGEEERPVIAEIHGAGFGHDNFAGISPILGRKYRVLDFDMRGFGLSDRPSQHYDMEIWADDLAILLETLKIESAHVHGTSMGGTIALQFAIKYPEKVRSLILTATACKSDYAMKINADSWMRIAKEQGVGSLCLAEVLSYQALSKKFLDSEEGPKMVQRIAEIMGRNNSLEVFVQGCQAIFNTDLTRRLPEIKAPTLVIVGDQDIMTPLHQGPQGGGSDVIHDMIKGSELVIMKDSPHTFLFEQPEEAAGCILTFLEKLEQIVAE